MTLDPDKWHVRRGTWFYIFAIITHSIIIYWVINHFTWPALLAGFIGYLFIGKLGGDIGFHRFYSHNAFSTTPFWEWMMVFCGSLLGYGSSIDWLIMHHAHHMDTDGKDDPHSPYQQGPWRVYFRVYFNEVKIDRTCIRRVRRAHEDYKQKFFHENLMKVYMSWAMLSIGLSLTFDSWVPIIGMWVFPVVLTYHTSALVDIVCHKWGYQTYSHAGNSRNNAWINVLLFGIGMHNNHHGRPHDYDNSGDKWYEFDTGGFFVKNFMISTK